MSEENRKAFEAAVIDGRIDCPRQFALFGGEWYDHCDVQIAWESWQAATAHAQARTCKWVPSHHLQLWKTACGVTGWSSTVNFCFHCGGKVEVVSE
jgi:NADH pyrophosphatase NudC (nudix superfamily)